MRVEGYREDSEQNQVMGFRSARKKVPNGAEERATEKMRSCITRIARRVKKPKHPDFQDTTSKMPYHTHYSCWFQALQATCYRTVDVWKALGKQPQTQGRIMGREEKERKKKLDRDQTLPHGTEQWILWVPLTTWASQESWRLLAPLGGCLAFPQDQTKNNGLFYMPESLNKNKTQRTI